MNKTVLLVCMSLLIVAGGRATYAQSTFEQHIDELSRQITSKVSSKQKATIALVEFADLEGHITNFGRFLAEELITRLHETKNFKVIERQLLNQIIKEQKLTLTGIVDPSSAKQLGKLLGVDAIVSGSISDLGGSLRINARMISTETGEIFAVASTEIFKDDAVARLLGSDNQNPDDRTSTGDSSTGGKKSVPKIAKARTFTFQLTQCTHFGASVNCDLTITNNVSQDQPLGYYRLSPERVAKIIDNEGNQGNPTAGQIGNMRGDLTHMVSGVATKATISFEGISPDASSLKLISIWFQTLKDGFIVDSFNVEFRDVSFSK
jgi:TolB-like protein